MHASERYARMRLHVQTRKPVHTDIRLKCRSVLQLFLADRLEVHGTMLSMLFDFGNTRFPRHPRRVGPIWIVQLLLRRLINW